jgi:hypothetical protein
MLIIGAAAGLCNFAPTLVQTLRGLANGLTFPGNNMPHPNITWAIASVVSTISYVIGIAIGGILMREGRRSMARALDAEQPEAL